MTVRHVPVWAGVSGRRRGSGTPNGELVELLDRGIETADIRVKNGFNVQPDAPMSGVVPVRSALGSRSAMRSFSVHKPRL